MINRQEVIQRIREQIPCTDYLEKSKGENMYCCPSCKSGTGKNGTGAVKYYPKTNTWHCHACGAGNDVIDAYRMQTGTDFSAAVASLSETVGLDVPSNGLSAPQSHENPQSNISDHQEENPAQIADYSTYYEECTERLSDPAAVSYLTARGISVDLASRLRIGFDPAADPANAPGSLGDTYKPHPCPRMIIPTSRAHYIARSIDPETPKKYEKLNPSKYFGGGNVSLFNRSALKDLDAGKVIFVCEGWSDAASFLMAGQSAIALNSKSNGKLLVDAVKGQAGKGTFVVVPDNDNDPETARKTIEQAQALAKDLREAGHRATVYNVAGIYHDANDSWVKDQEGFKDRIAEAIKDSDRDEITDFLEKVQSTVYKPHATGLDFFDKLLDGGIVNQSILILMAAPSTGKTTLAQQIAESIAERGRKMLYLNFEMSREQMIAKSLCAMLNNEITTNKILRGYEWSETERGFIVRAAEDYRRKRLPFIKYNPEGCSNDLDGLLSFLTAEGEKARTAREPAPGVVVDYLHLISSSKRIDLPELIKQAVKGLKQYAIDYDSFVIILSATNRSSNESGRITDSSARDSSNIEYTGDYQLSLNYADLDSGRVKPKETDKVEELKQENPRRMILRLHKNRMGEIGKSVRLNFDPKHNRFSEGAEFLMEGTCLTIY